jgi:hypothetical protein
MAAAGITVVTAATEILRNDIEKLANEITGAGSYRIW